MAERGKHGERVVVYWQEERESRTERTIKSTQQIAKDGTRRKCATVRADEFLLVSTVMPSETEQSGSRFSIKLLHLLQPFSFSPSCLPTEM